MLILGLFATQITLVSARSAGTVAGSTLTGVAAGAAAGSIIPGLGTGVGAVVGGIFGLAGSVIAGKVFSGMLTSGVYYLFFGIAYLLSYVAAAVFFLGGYFIDFALKINEYILTSSVVKTGWEIVLNFTNLGFVLAIIIIAFATIFRIQSYAMKQTLWKLIVAALLVNFSLVISGAFINIGNGLAYYFQKNITPEGSVKGFHQFSVKLAEILRVQALISGKDAEELRKNLEEGKYFEKKGEQSSSPESPTLPDAEK